MINFNLAIHELQRAALVLAIHVTILWVVLSH